MLYDELVYLSPEKECLKRDTPSSARRGKLLQSPLRRPVAGERHAGSGDICLLMLFRINKASASRQIWIVKLAISRWVPKRRPDCSKSHDHDRKRAG